MELAELSLEKLEEEIKGVKEFLEGQVIVWTKVPHKRGELKGKLPYLVRQQLRLNESQFRELIAWPMGRKEYIEVLRGKGLIPLSEGE